MLGNRGCGAHVHPPTVVASCGRAALRAAAPAACPDLLAGCRVRCGQAGHVRRTSSAGPSVFGSGDFLGHGGGDLPLRAGLRISTCPRGSLARCAAEAASKWRARRNAVCGRGREVRKAMDLSVTLALGRWPWRCGAYSGVGAPTVTWRLRWRWAPAVTLGAGSDVGAPAVAFGRLR